MIADAGEHTADHTLPPGWTHKYDQNIGRVYYLNLETLKRQWHKPQAEAASGTSTSRLPQGRSLKKAVSSVILARKLSLALSRPLAGEDATPPPLTSLREDGGGGCTPERCGV